MNGHILSGQRCGLNAVRVSDTSALAHCFQRLLYRRTSRGEQGGVDTFRREITCCRFDVILVAIYGDVGSKPAGKRFFG